MDVKVLVTDVIPISVSHLCLRAFKTVQGLQVDQGACELNQHKAARLLAGTFHWKRKYVSYMGPQCTSVEVRAVNRVRQESLFKADQAYLQGPIWQSPR